MPSEPTAAIDAPTQLPAPARPFWRFFSLACTLAALGHPLASALSRHFWIADLLSHFQEPALALTIFATIINARCHRRVALGLALLAVVQTVPILRYSGANPVKSAPASTDRLRIVLANVLFENENYDEVISLIRAERPDIVGLVEIDPAWQKALSVLRDDYPFRVEYPAGASGLAIWFRKAPTVIDPPESLLPGRNPVIHAVFEFAGRSRHLWLVHPSSPISSRLLIAGNPEIDAIARRVGQVKGSRLVLGDMNSTDGSAHFRDFLRVSGLRDSRLGFGRQGSWPSDMPYRISIDHAFLSDDLAVVDRRLGFLSGSDHLPLIVDLAPPVKDSSQAAKASTSPP